MAKAGRGDSVGNGLGWGLVLGLVFVLAPVLWLGGEGALELALVVHPMWTRLQDLATTNLQGSIGPFSVVFLCYCWQLRSLHIELATVEPVLDRVARRDQLLDLSASLFFGIGVIWTAVGMRDALLFGLGDPGLATREGGAFSVLQRLVEGGILIALSTTIVGGVGGYLMRVAKSVAVGERLNTLYLEASQRPLQQNTATLQRIEQLLAEGAGGRDGEEA